MPLLAADPVTVLPEQHEALERLVRTRSTPQQLALRAHIIAQAADGMRVRASAPGTRRLAQDGTVLAQTVAGGGGQAVGLRAAGRCATLGGAGNVHARTDLRSGCDDLREAVGERAADQPLEPARDCRRSHATWPGPEHLAALGGAFFKKEADLKPHRIRYWLTPKPDPAFDAKCADICAVYKAAATPDDDHRTISIDEMTGIQALERIAPELPMVPGKIERREFEYRRHGTQTLIAAFDVATGKVEGVIGNTRTEKDFARFLRRLLSSAAPNVRCGHRLRQPQHPSFRGRRPSRGSPLRAQGQARRQRQVRRARFQGHSRRLLVSVRASHHLPLHAQTRLVAQPIEIWFSILARKLLRRGNFASKKDLRTKIEQFIAYFNRTMAKPFRWTMEAKPLTG